MISANISESNDQFQVVELSSESSYDPSAIHEAIAAVSELEIDFQKGVIISHRGAIWLHSALAHHFHVAAWVAHLDPRLGGAVVVQSHGKNSPQVESIIKIPKLQA